MSSQCHPSHKLKTTEGVLFCRNCGAYTTKRPTALRMPCRGMPPNESRRNVLRRLSAGLLPTTARYLHEIAEAASAEAAKITSRSMRGGDAPATSPAAVDIQSDANNDHLIIDQRAHDGSGDNADSSFPADVAREEYLMEQHRGHLADYAAIAGDSQGEARDVRFQPPLGMPPTVSCDTVPFHGMLQRRSVQLVNGGSVSQPIQADEEDGQQRMAGRDGEFRSAAGAGQSATAETRRCTARPVHAEDVDVSAGGDAARSELLINEAASTNPTHAAAATTARSDTASHRVAHWCRPADGSGSSWTKRVQLQPNDRGGKCHLCGTAARTKCRGCGLSLCIGCAKGRIGCRIGGV